MNLKRKTKNLHNYYYSDKIRKKFKGNNKYFWKIISSQRLTVKRQKIIINKKIKRSDKYAKNKISRNNSYGKWFCINA